MKEQIEAPASPSPNELTEIRQIETIEELETKIAPDGIVVWGQL